MGPDHDEDYHVKPHFADKDDDYEPTEVYHSPEEVVMEDQILLSQTPVPISEKPEGMTWQKFYENSILKTMVTTAIVDIGDAIEYAQAKGYMKPPAKVSTEKWSKLTPTSPPCGDWFECGQMEEKNDWDQGYTKGK